MSLKRKENNLRRAQARFDRINDPPRWKVISRYRSRQLQIEFRRETNRRGRYRTRPHIVSGAVEYHGSRYGILHRVVGLKYRIKGDKPSVTRFINSFEPTTKRGKLFKATAQAANFIVHDTARTAVDAGLALETAALKTADIARRETVNKLKQKYVSEAVDDHHRGVIFIRKTAADAVRGTREHFKAKKQFQLEKAKYDLQKADYKLFKPKSYESKMQANYEDLQKARRQYRSRIVRDRSIIYRRAMNKRRSQAYRQSKRELKFERKLLKSEKTFRVKELKNQKKIARDSRPGLLVLKPVKYSAKRMRASAWQKAVNEDRDNDFLHAADSVKRRVAEPVAEHFSKPRRLQR